MKYIFVVWKVDVIAYAGGEWQVIAMVFFVYRVTGLLGCCNCNVGGQMDFCVFGGNTRFRCLPTGFSFEAGYKIIP